MSRIEAVKKQQNRTLGIYPRSYNRTLVVLNCILSLSKISIEGYITDVYS
jgi:hypothetical protein